MPMQPSPCSLTTRPWVPSFRVFTSPPVWLLCTAGQGRTSSALEVKADLEPRHSPRSSPASCRLQLAGLERRLHLERGSVRLDPLVDASRRAAEGALDVVARPLEV